MHILAIRYLEEKAFCFTEVIEDNKKLNKDGEKIETVSNSEKKRKKKLYIKKRGISGLYHLQPLVYLQLRFLCLGFLLFCFHLRLLYFCLYLGSLFYLYLRLLYLYLCKGPLCRLRLCLLCLCVYLSCLLYCPDLVYLYLNLRC